MESTGNGIAPRPAAGPATPALGIQRSFRLPDGINVATWPSFARHLLRANPRGGMSDLLAEVASIADNTDFAASILREFFGEDPRAGRIASLVEAVDHVGALAPAGAGTADAERALRSSPFALGLRGFTSRILAADLSTRVGREVRVDVVEARMAPDGPGTGFEWFVADLPADELHEFLRREIGCHVALRLLRGVRPESVHEIASLQHGTSAPALVTPVRVNPEIGVRLFYLEREHGEGRFRRLELIASA